VNYAPMPQAALSRDYEAKLGASAIASGPPTNAVPRETGALTSMTERIGFLLTRMEQELHRGHVAMDRLLPDDPSTGGAPIPAPSGAPILAFLSATIERLESNVHKSALLANRVERAV